MRMDISGLKKLAKAVETPVLVKVGVLLPDAQKVHRESNLTMAQLGVLHEFGYVAKMFGGRSVEVPARSFIRMPLGNEFLVPLFRRAAKNLLLEKTDRNTILKTVGQTSMAAIQSAFLSRGHGRWKALSRIARMMRLRRGNPDTTVLVDTGQLRDSISWKEYANDYAAT